VKVLQTTLVSEIHDIIAILVRKRSKMTILFSDDFQTIDLFPSHHQNYDSFRLRRGHLIIGEWVLPPSFDTLFKKCLTVLDKNGVTILWDV